MDLFLFFLILILLLIAYISATKKYVSLPNKETKKNMDIYYHKLNKNIKINEYHYFEENFDLLIFSTQLGSTIRLQPLQKTKRWQYYRSSVMALGDSIYISSGICKSFE